MVKLQVYRPYFWLLGEGQTAWLALLALRVQGQSLNYLTPSRRTSCHFAGDRYKRHSNSPEFHLSMYELSRFSLFARWLWLLAALGQ